jgi:WD40 repeat protein
MKKRVWLLLLVMLFLGFIKIQKSFAQEERVCRDSLPTRLLDTTVARVTAGAANNIRAEADSGSERLGQIPGGESFTILDGEDIDRLVFHPGQDKLVALVFHNGQAQSGNTSFRLVLWDIEQNTELAIFQELEDDDYSQDFVFHPDGSTLLLTNPEGLAILDIDDAGLLAQLSLPASQERSIDIHPDGTRFLVSQGVNAFVFDYDSLLASAHQENAFPVELAPLVTLDRDLEVIETLRASGTDVYVTSLAFSADGA